MFRDRDEELRRLQEQLLEEEEPEENADLEEDEDFETEEDLDALLDEDTEIGASGVYQNYSNDYGRNLRNYATGYKAYNADRTDTDLERYSDAVREEPKRSSAVAWFVVLLLVLMGLVVGVIAWKYLGLGDLL